MEIRKVCTVHSACAVHRQNQVNVAPVSVMHPCPQMVTISNLGAGGLTDSIKTFGVLMWFPVTMQLYTSVFYKFYILIYMFHVMILQILR